MTRAEGWITDPEDDALHPERPCRRCGGNGVAFEATPREVQMLTHSSWLLVKVEGMVSMRGTRIGHQRYVRLGVFLYDQDSSQNVTIGPLAVCIARLETLIANGYAIHGESPTREVPPRRLLCPACKGWGGIVPPT